MIWLVDWSRVLGTAAESWKARRVAPRFLQKTDGRCDAQEGQSEDITDGLRQRRRGSREASLDGKDRDESTGSDDEASLTSRRGDRDEWTVGVNNCRRTLATIVACGRQHKGVVILVLDGATPGLVVRRQERFRHSIGRAVPADHEALGHTSEAAESQACDLELRNRRMAPNKSASSAREKPTKVKVDDEGRSGVRSAKVSHQVWERKVAQKRSACATRFCVMKQTEYGEREDGSACGKLFEEGKQTNLEGLDGMCRRSR